MILKNLIVLGQGAPNQLKDGRQSRCVCAYSEEGKYIRIYPMPIGFVRKWDVFSVKVDKPESDNRENTWKIFNSKDDWNHLEKWVQVNKENYPESKRKELIHKLSKDVLSDLRKNRNSFGIIKPKIIKFELEQRNVTTTAQTTLLDLDYHIINQKDYKYKPYLTFSCDGACDCKNPIHREQIIEWGCYEFMRKNPGKENQLQDNLRLFDDSYEKYLLVGNIFKSPHTYIIIDIFRWKKP